MEREKKERREDEGKEAISYGCVDIPNGKRASAAPFQLPLVYFGLSFVISFFPFLFLRMEDNYRRPH